MAADELWDAELWDALPGYLNTAAYGLPPRPAVTAVTGVLDDWRTGRTSWEPWDEAVDQARATFARLAGVPVTDVSVGATVSELLGHIAAALPAGARVAVPDCEFTSNLFPWLAQAGRGVQVTMVPLGELVHAIDTETTLVAFSLVQSASGEIAPWRDIVTAARHHGALVVTDATQACGWLPFETAEFDAVAVHAYKWLMSPRGSSFLMVRPALRDQLSPLAASWYAGQDRHASYYGPPLRLAADARRFDTSPAWLSWAGTAAALAVIEQIGVEPIYEHNVRLASRLRAGLGLPAAQSAILSAQWPGAEEKLAKAGVRASMRAGQVRLSCHVYNTDADVDLALNALTS